MFERLLDFQQSQVMVQVSTRHDERRHTPVLTAIGTLGGGPLLEMAVVVGERQLGARVRALTADDHPRPRRPTGEVEAVSELGDLTVVALCAVLVER